MPLPDFTALDAVVDQLKADVTNQASLEDSYEAAEAALTTGQAALAAANDARQVGLKAQSADQAAVTAAISVLLTPPVDPNATPVVTS